MLLDLSDTGADVLYDYQKWNEVSELLPHNLRELKVWLHEEIKTQYYEINRERRPALTDDRRQDYLDTIKELRSDIQIVNRELDEWKKAQRNQLNLPLKRKVMKCRKCHSVRFPQARSGLKT